MDVAAGLGAACVVVAPGRREGRSYEETRDLAARALTEVFERATRPGVRLAVEPIIAWQSDYLNTLGEAVELVELVGHPTSASTRTRSTSGARARCWRTSSGRRVASSVCT